MPTGALLKDLGSISPAWANGANDKSAITTDRASGLAIIRKDVYKDGYESWCISLNHCFWPGGKRHGVWSCSLYLFRLVVSLAAEIPDEIAGKQHRWYHECEAKPPPLDGPFGLGR